MAATIEYDDGNLQRLFAEMEPEKRLKAIKGAFRREARKVRETAVRNLHKSIAGDEQMGRGIRAIVFKRKAGFRVTIGTKKADKNGKSGYGYYLSRRLRKKAGAKPKPVLIWAEAGTKWRRTKTKTRVFTRKRIGHSTGYMKRYGFMQKTLAQVRDSVTDGLHKEVIDSITKTAQKYGCT